MTAPILIERDPATGTPIAPVLAVVCGRVAVRCPYCGRKHWHGTAGQADTERDFGHRIAHCATGGSYLLRRN